MGNPPILLPNSKFSAHTSLMVPGVPLALFLRFLHSILPHTVQNVTKTCGNEASFHCVQKFGQVFNLAIWRSRRKSPNLIQPILNPAAPCRLVLYYFKKYTVHSPEKAMSGILLSLSVSGKEVCVTNECMRHALNRGPTQSYLEAKQITASTQQRRGRRCEGMAPKTSRQRLLDNSIKILDGKLP